jgi:hypothetical protein
MKNAVQRQLIAFPFCVCVKQSVMRKELLHTDAHLDFIEIHIRLCHGYHSSLRW